MITIRNPTLTSNIPTPEIRSLIEQRFAQICAGDAYNYDLHGYMIIVEPGDSVESLEQESSCPILRGLFDNTSFGDPDFSPSFEALDEHAECYEMVFILNDDGFGIGIFIPKNTGINADLLAMCAEYAVPATDFTV